MPDVPVSAKQIEIDQARKAARRATDDAVSEFRVEKRLYEARVDMKKFVMDQVPRHPSVPGHIMSLAVSYSQEARACTATVWFDLPDGSPSNKDRDQARILLAHVLGIAICATFFKQSNGLTQSSDELDAGQRAQRKLDSISSKIETMTADIERLSAQMLKRSQNREDLQEQWDRFTAGIGDGMAMSKEEQRRLATLKSGISRDATEIKAYQADIAKLKERLDALRARKNAEEAALGDASASVVYEDSFLDAMKASDDPSVLSKWVARLSVNPDLLSVVNFPGTFVSTTSQPASTQARVLLDRADATVATGALQNALESFESNPALHIKQISNYVLAAFIQVLVGYGYAYVGSTDLGSNSQRTVRTKLCVSLDDRLHGPSDVLWRDDNGRRTLWSESAYRDYVYESIQEGQLEAADSIVKSIIERIAMAVVARSTDAELLDHTALKYLYRNTRSRAAGYIEERTTDLGVVYMVASMPPGDFLAWMEGAAAEADGRFVRRLAELRNPSTGVAKTVCVKLLNYRTRLSFGTLERSYLKHVLGVGDPMDITPSLVQRMLRNLDEQYNGLRECHRELQEKEEQERRRRTAANAKKRLEREQKEDKHRIIRVPIVELALLGWGNRREPLGQEQLKYLLDDLTKTGYTPRNYITRDPVSSATVSQQTLSIVRDGAELLQTLLSAFPNIGKEVAELKRTLKRRACDAILAGATTFEVLVADYLTHVEQVVGFHADNYGRVDQSGLDALYSSDFANRCKKTQKKRDAKERGMYLEGGEGGEGDEEMDDDSGDFFGLGPLRPVDGGGEGGKAMDDDWGPLRPVGGGGGSSELPSTTVPGLEDDEEDR